ncbi:Haloacid dehalogenase-like hydrolase domain-containing protein 2 [Podila epicladia]|nr:Haloacid dehalogenase-like hydrolase domain-containing protein 2 [Podila epicladia]KAG0098356.1 Haloacid dehalogenase-like hydrolase domain-containing protein 2 [Podila epicladia]
MQSIIRGVLIDVSGTVHVADKAIPGAVKALDRLRASGVPFRFCTNTTQTSGETLAKKLRDLGFNVNRDEIFTSLSACRQLVQSRKLRPLLFLEPDALQEFDGIPQSEPHDSVVIGLSPSNFNYDMMNRAFRILAYSERTETPATLIAIHKAKYFADKDNGTLSMGPGGFVEALEYASGIKAHVVGKPQKAFFELAIQNMGLSSPSPSSSPTPTNIAMIGDDVEQDLGGGAAELGLVRFLVQTGKYRPRDEDRDAFGGLSGGTFADFAAVVDHILKHNSAQG